MNRTAAASNENSTVRTVLVSAFGLLPVGAVSGLMLLQILGVWTY